MPKNIIPKDNIPKIYEVREIKSEIPTYEEFLKNYNAGEKASNSYENELNSYSDIGSPKIYGPMYRASTERNANERFTPLKIPCLGVNCSNTEAFDWHHSTCGGNFQISNRGRLKCNGCSLVEDIKNFSFKCSSHSGNYLSVSSQMDISAFKRALFSALSQGAMDESITMELIQHLR